MPCFGGRTEIETCRVSLLEGEAASDGYYFYLISRLSGRLFLSAAKRAFNVSFATLPANEVPAGNRCGRGCQRCTWTWKP